MRVGPLFQVQEATTCMFLPVYVLLRCEESLLMSQA